MLLEDPEYVADERIDHAQLREVPVARAHLGEQDEGRRQQDRLEEIVHAEERDTGGGKNEDDDEQAA